MHRLALPFSGLLILVSLLPGCSDDAIPQTDDTDDPSSSTSTSETAPTATTHSGESTLGATGTTQTTEAVTTTGSSDAETTEGGEVCGDAAMPFAFDLSDAWPTDLGCAAGEVVSESRTGATTITRGTLYFEDCAGGCDCLGRGEAPVMTLPDLPDAALHESELFCSRVEVWAEGRPDGTCPVVGLAVSDVYEPGTEWPVLVLSNSEHLPPSFPADRVDLALHQACDETACSDPPAGRYSVDFGSGPVTSDDEPAAGLAPSLTADPKLEYILDVRNAGVDPELCTTAVSWSAQSTNPNPSA